MKLVRRRCSMFVQKTAQAESRAGRCGVLFAQAAKPFSEHDFLGWQSILPRWGKPWVSYVFGYKHAVRRGGGKGRVLVSSYMHIVAAGRGEERLGWPVLGSTEARRDGGCSGGAVGL